MCLAMNAEDDVLGEYSCQLKSTLQLAASSGGTVPQQLLSKIDHVFSLMEKDSISTTKLSALLELLSKACKFSCTVMCNELGNELGQIQAEANEMIVSDKQSLTDDRDQFSSGVDKIDKFLSELEVMMDQSDIEYSEIMSELKTEAFANLCRQERLGEHLWRLEQKKEELERHEAEENRTRIDLKEELCSNNCRQEKIREQLQGLEKRLRVVEVTASAEEFLQDKGEEEYSSVVEGFREEREELVTLYQQAETSLLIVDTMSECVQFIMEDAKKKKQDWQQKLHDMRLKNLLQLRDSLMATASIHMMRVDYCVEDADQTTSELDISTEQQQQRETQSQHEEKMKELQAELVSTDGQIQALNPHLNLDTLEERYEQRRRVACSQNSISAAELSSHGNYTEERHTQRQRPSWTGWPSQSPHSSTSRKPHQCKYCQKNFKYPSGLQQHIVTHIGEKPYQCDFCQKRFTRHWRLQQHILTHTGENLYQCEYCQKRFTEHSGLRRHILTHTGEKPYQCEYCQKRFTKHWNLQQHILTHTGEKLYQCEYCQKRFTQHSVLRRHILTHTGEKPHQCD